MEVFSQEELVQLIINNARADEPKENKTTADGRKKKIYDFKRPDKFSREQIRTISTIHETFSHLTNNSLITKLCSTCHIDVASVDQLTYEEFIRSIPTPTTFAAIDMDPLKGFAFLEIDPDITIFIIDRICGGTGEKVKRQRELTDIEQNIMEGIIVCLLENMREAWSQVIEIRPRLSRIGNPLIFQIVRPTDMIVLITFKVNLGDVDGYINFCIPYNTVKPIAWMFCAPYRYEGTLYSSEQVELENIPIKLNAEILRQDYTIKEIREWEVGTKIIPVRPLSPEHCFLRFGDRRVWQCEILPDNKRSLKRIKNY
jgi:flagellar motor switch protein FliM